MAFLTTFPGMADGNADMTGHGYQLGGSPVAPLPMKPIIVIPTTVFLAEDAICLGNLLKALFRLRSTVVAIGVKLHGEPAVSRFDFRCGSVFLHIQQLVVVRAHGSA